MTLYLNKEICETMLKKTIATACKKLNEISNIKDKNDIEYKNLLEEIKLINKIVESLNSYLSFIN